MLALLVPGTLFAFCSKEGSTVVYVNGIFTSLGSARRDLAKLREEFFRKSEQKNVEFINGYNESHIEGAGDLIQSAAQIFNSTVSDYDLKTILLQIHPYVTTRKVLLVGHSQGTFYTNALYDYLTQNGIPKESVAVYNLATPASFVSGGGTYLTSANDKLIYNVRQLAAASGAKDPLPSNILIPLPKGEENDKWGGHHFGSSYLNMKPARIVSDIGGALGKLQAGETTDGACFTAPNANIGYKVMNMTFTVADPMSRAIFSSAIAVKNVTKSLADAIENAFTFITGSNNQAGAVAVTTVPVSPNTVPQEEIVQKISSALIPQFVSKPTPIESSSIVPPVLVPTAQPQPIPQEVQILGVNFFPQSSSGSVPVAEIVEEVAPAPTPDTMPPGTPSVSITECSYSLSSNFCFIPQTTATLVWGDALDASYYRVILNEVSGATTTATTTTATLTNNATSTFNVVAYDTVGNAATSSAVSVFAFVQPLIISEIGWAGTQASSSDQWLEVRNLSSYALSTSNLSLRNASSSVTLSFSGSISALGFFLFEKRQEATSYSNNATFSNALSTSGEELLLTWNSVTIIDQTPAMATCAGWCFGFFANAIVNASSMERLSGASDGTTSSSWGDGVPATTPATDASLNTICGTPGGSPGSGTCDPIIVSFEL